MFKFDNNTIRLKDFQLPFSYCTDSNNFRLKESREVMKYEKDASGNSVKTDVFSHTNLTVADPETLCTFTIKVEKKLAIPDTDERLRVEIDPERTFVKPYRIQYGEMKVSIVTDDVTISVDN